MPAPQAPRERPFHPFLLSPVPRTLWCPLAVDSSLPCLRHHPMTCSLQLRMASPLLVRTPSPGDLIWSSLITSAKTYSHEGHIHSSIIVPNAACDPDTSAPPSSWRHLPRSASVPVASTASLKTLHWSSGPVQPPSPAGVRAPPMPLPPSLCSLSHAILTSTLCHCNHVSTVHLSRWVLGSPSFTSSSSAPSQVRDP
uniref:Uncharacterized protein n=1 Tax=Molossus molossus TaxID=27622 RepID=A0A7J8JV86_MOLMO|nr:hypothetical protein HJG59_007799 [Molossus molossus]